MGEDFGKPPDPEKQRIREFVWRKLEREGVALFPGAWGRIPNFRGAERAAKLAAGLEVFKRAKVIKANPDSPQRWLRQAALEQGKVVYMAVPRLRDERCFVELDPSKLAVPASRAATIKGAFQLGRKVYPWQMRPVDLVIAGSVAVNRKGQRIGKGGGFSDLEFAIARHFGKISANTPVLTTVHSLQVLGQDLPFYSHDISVDFIITEREIITCPSRPERPSGIFWELLTLRQLEMIPLLRAIKEGKTG